MIWIDGYPFDLAVTQTSTYPGEATTHPVDADADITDHIRANPTELTLECVVSDTPIGAVAADPTRQPGVAPFFGEAAFEKLLEIRARRRPVIVITPKRTYDSMAIVSVEREESVETGGGAAFTVSFQQVRVVANKRITVRSATIAKPKATLGTKQPKQSKLVERRVDAHDGTWFDPDINAWRNGASYNPTTNQWEYFKGTPVGDYPRGLSDGEYKKLIAEQRDGALIPLDKKGIPGASAGQRILLPGQF